MSVDVAGMMREAREAADVRPKIAFLPFPGAYQCELWGNAQTSRPLGTGMGATREEAEAVARANACPIALETGGKYGCGGASSCCGGASGI